MKHSEVPDWVQRRNRKNLVFIYRKELNGLAEGKNASFIALKPARKRCLREAGLIHIVRGRNYSPSLECLTRLAEAENK